MMRGGAWLAGVALLAGCEASFFQTPGGGIGATSKGEFSPTVTKWAIIDRYENAADGTNTALKKRDKPRLIIIFSRAAFDPEVDIAGLPTDEREDLLHNIATQHSLYVEELLLEDAGASHTVEAHKEPPTGPFAFWLRRPVVESTANADYSNLNVPLGGDQKVKLHFTSVNLDSPITQLQRIGIEITIAIKQLALSQTTSSSSADGSSVDMGSSSLLGSSSVAASSSREALASSSGPSSSTSGITGAIAAVTTTDIVFTESIPLVAERLGESNLQFLRPILTSP